MGPVTGRTGSTVDVGGIPFQVTTLEEGIETVLTHARDPGSGIAIRLTNAYCVALADKDRRYKALLTGRGINFPDGAPVVWAMNTNSSSRVRAARVRGPSLFLSVLERGRSVGIRHFFLGATPETLDLLIQRLSSSYPGIVIAGTHAPDFRDFSELDLDKFARIVVEAEADIVWVGLGSPKQDFIAQGLADRAPVCAAGVGAAFDFAAGTKLEAPTAMQKAGLEWLFRLWAEPRRLWRRYLFGNLRFILVAARDAWKTQGNR